MIRGLLEITPPFRCQCCLCEEQYWSPIFSIHVQLLYQCYFDKSGAQIQDVTHLTGQAFLLPWWDCWPFYPEASSLGHIDLLQAKHGSIRPKHVNTAQQEHLDVCLHITFSRDLYSNTTLKFSDASLVPLHSLFLFSCRHRGCLLQAVAHHIR